MQHVQCTILTSDVSADHTSVFRVLTLSGGPESQMIAIHDRCLITVTFYLIQPNLSSPRTKSRVPRGCICARETQHVTDDCGTVQIPVIVTDGSPNTIH